MRITLDYGRTGLEIEVPDERLVGPLGIRPVPPVADPPRAVRDALDKPISSPPLAALARGRRNACILACDITRPVPNRLLLPPILEILQRQGIPRGQILLLIATGLHRPNEGAELEELLGPEIVANYRVGNDWVVDSGLAAGDRVVIEGIGKLKPGALVKPVAATAKAKA